MGATVKVIHTSIITEWTIKKTRNIKRTVCVCVWQLCLLPSAMFCIKQRSGWACEICMTALANLDAVISFSCAFILVFVCVSGYVHQRICPAMDAQDKTIWIMRYENILCMTMTYLCILGPLSVYFSLFFFLYLLACVSALPEFKLWNGHVWSATPKETKNRNEGNVSIAYCSNHILDSIKLNVARVREHKKKIPTCSIKLLQPDATH